MAISTPLNTKIHEVKGEIPAITNLATNASLNANINGVKDETPNIANLATTAALFAVENKVPNINNLVKKDWLKNSKISGIENKIATDHNRNRSINTKEFYKLAACLDTKQV